MWGFLTILAVLMAVYYFVLCFFGYKTRRVFASIVGFLGGVVAGVAFAYLCFSELEYITLIAGVCALVIGIGLALLAWRFYNVGVFIYAMFTAYGIVYNLAAHLFAEHTMPSFTGFVTAVTTAPEHFSRVAMGIAIVVAIIFAVLAVKFVRPLLIVSTASHGGFSMAIVISVLLHQANSLPIVLGLGLVLLIAGLIVQIRMTKG